MKKEDQKWEAISACFLFLMFLLHLTLCFQSELNAKTPIVPVYREDGVTIDYVIINGVEHQILPTVSMDLLLDTLETREKQLKAREEQIDSYIKISERQKGDLEMCRADRDQAYKQLEMLLAATTNEPFYKSNEFSFGTGYLACAASFAVWKAVDNRIK